MISGWLEKLSWRRQRQIVLILIPLIPALLLSGFLIYRQFSTPTCNDGQLNQGELGIDCEGPCSAICSSRIIAPIITNVKAYPTFPGTYNLGAVVENPNNDLGVVDMPLEFVVYNSDDQEIYTKTVYHDLRPGSKSLVFDGPVKLSNTPDRLVLNVNYDSADWQIMSDLESDLVVENVQIQNPETEPRAESVIRNDNRRYYRNVPIGILVKSDDNQVVSISNTVIDLPARNTVVARFTWPAPFPTTKGVCIEPVDLVVAIDASGSMNSDNDNPPEPLTSVKEAAAIFASLFSANDRFGVVSFANEAVVELDPSNNSEQANRVAQIDSITITPEAEEGYTNLSDALSVSRGLLDNLNSSRTQALVVLTDGEPTAPDSEANPRISAQIQANELLLNNINLYAIGLGSAVDRSFLNSLTGDNSRTFTTLSVDEVQSIYQQIATSICERSPYLVEVLPNLPL